jgi:hypothetical protein
VNWIYSIGANETDVDIALQGAGHTTARFRGSRGGRDAVRFGVGAEIALTERTRSRVNVDEQIRNGTNATFGSGSIGVHF